MSNTMRLIFLDFDGVVHEARGDLEDDQYFEWLPILAEAIAPYPDVHVAVHSSWRHMFTADELRGFLHGLAERYVGAVPPGDREHAIREYLREVPHVRDYLVIDDTSEEFSRIRGQRLLICDPTTGLSAPDVQQRLSAWLANSRAAGTSSSESL
ncbi:MAG: HAD domain-containing protein [Burkholderiales bacterium]